MRMMLASVALGLLTSCFMADRDMTRSTVAVSIVGKCFALNQPTELVSFNNAKPEILYAPEPNDIYANPVIRKRVGLEVLDTVPKGTHIIISKVIDSFRGEEVRTWDVYAMLRGENGNDKEVRIPTRILNIPQSWLVEWSSEVSGQPVRFDGKWLTPCEVAAP